MESRVLIDLYVLFPSDIARYRGFQSWEKPFADTYMGISGSKGQFLGFWAVAMQASFSFSGSEVPGIAAGKLLPVIWL
jgi:amino acid permease